MRLTFVISCTFIAVLMSACSGEKMNNITAQPVLNENVSDEAWKKLSEVRIYFGHQSVGYNIVDGIREAIKDDPKIRLNILETNDPSSFNMPVFAHSRVGRNMYPISKIESFSENMERGIANRANIAFFKFCYADIKEDTDVVKLFDIYKEEFYRLKNKFPETKFIHMTVPINVSNTTFKTRIKMIFAKEKLWEYLPNIKRNDFNELMTKEYNGKEYVFDLARLESTFPGGRRSSFSLNGKTYYSLVPEYASDGSHLNEEGRKIIAKKLIVFLSQIAMNQ